MGWDKRNGTTKRGKIRRGIIFSLAFDFSLLLDPVTDAGSFLVLARACRGIVKGHFGVTTGPHKRRYRT
jgi:hypothetical protein